jgi:hypothetical protein
MSSIKNLNSQKTIKKIHLISKYSYKIIYMCISRHDHAKSLIIVFTSICYIREENRGRWWVCVDMQQGYEKKSDDLFCKCIKSFN